MGKSFQLFNYSSKILQVVRRKCFGCLHLHNLKKTPSKLVVTRPKTVLYTFRFSCKCEFQWPFHFKASHGLLKSSGFDPCEKLKCYLAAWAVPVWSAKTERPPCPALTESDKALGNGGWESTFLFGNVQREDARAGGRGTDSKRERERKHKTAKEKTLSRQFCRFPQHSSKRRAIIFYLLYFLNHWASTDRVNSPLLAFCPFLVSVSLFLSVLFSLSLSHSVFLMLALNYCICAIDRLSE